MGNIPESIFDRFSDGFDRFSDCFGNHHGFQEASENLLEIIKFESRLGCFLGASWFRLGLVLGRRGRVRPGLAWNGKSVRRKNAQVGIKIGSKIYHNSI